MASIERTAYPRFKRNLTQKELQDVYIPTPQDVQFGYRVARGAEPLLHLLVMDAEGIPELGILPVHY